MVILKNISVLQKIKENENITSSYTVNAKHVYNIYTMLDQRCIDVIQMFYVSWVLFKYLSTYFNLFDDKTWWFFIEGWTGGINNEE